MFLPRADACSSGLAGCSSSSPSEAAPSESDSTSATDTSLMDRPGSRRYIGIGMVLGLLLIVFLAWLYNGKWPRRMLRQYYCCSRRSKQLPTSIEHTRDDCLPTTKEDNPLEDSEKSLAKGVSRGVLVFTQVPKALGRKDRHPIEGIRLETPNPQRHHAKNVSRQS